MADFADDGTETYFEVVYGKGGAALLAAREAAGAEPFDAAVRCYVDASAWSTATADDVAAALADLPAALQVLVDSGALDTGDLPR
jgi:aminopeptidase N